MCVTVAKSEDIDFDCATRFQDNPTAINFCLGQKKTRMQLNAYTPNGKRKRKEVVKDINLSIQATCYNVIHRHILEKNFTATLTNLMVQLIVMITTLFAAFLFMDH